MVRIFVFLGLITLTLGDDWQTYVDQNLIAPGLQHGAIFGADGSQLATSAGLSV